jgi:hypothetical protein
MASTSDPESLIATAIKPTACQVTEPGYAVRLATAAALATVSTMRRTRWHLRASARAPMAIGEQMQTKRYKPKSPPIAAVL